MKSKLIFLSLIIVSSLTLAACTGGEEVTTPSESGTAVEQKQGDTTKTGTITEVGGNYFITEAGGQPLQIQSYSVDLSAYVDQTVTVTGQFSGDELFVGKVE